MRFAPTITNPHFLFHRKSHPLVNLKLMYYFCHINNFLNLLDYVYTWNSDESLH